MNKFFELFQVFYIVRKQAYKLELSSKWKIHNVFYVLLLEQNIIRKKQVNNVLPESEKFETKDNKEYKVKAIIEKIMYDKKRNNQMPGLYYFVLWKDFLKEKSFWELLNNG